MKHFATAFIVSLTLVLLACGGSSNNTDALTGNWTAALLNPDGTRAFGFTTTLNQNGQSVNVTKFSLISPSSCFAPGTAATALFTLIDNTHGVTSGTLLMTVQSGPSNPNGANTLALQGTLVGNSISGSWTLTGTGTECTEAEAFLSGNFTMIQM
jgi:hypothetical protein